MLEVVVNGIFIFLVDFIYVYRFLIWVELYDMR